MYYVHSSTRGSFLSESFGRDATAMQGAGALRSEERASPSKKKKKKKKRAQSDKVFLSPSLSLDVYAATAPQSIGDWCMATREGYTYDTLKSDSLT